MINTVELIARLRATAVIEMDDLHHEAADALAAQTQEIERLRSVAVNAALTGNEIVQDLAKHTREQERHAEAAEARIKADTETIGILRAELGRVGVLKESYLTLRLDLMERIDRLEARVEFLERTYVPRIPNEGG
jgi:hypothetical protein